MNDDTRSDEVVDHSKMDHAAMGHEPSPEGEVDPHAGHVMDHEAGEVTDHEAMDHAGMGHEEMDHAAMGHEGMVHHVAADGTEVMVMPGIPPALFGFGVGAVIIASFVFLEWRGLSKRSLGRILLTGKGRHRKWLKKKWFQAAFQIPFVLIFAFAIYAGLFGNMARNITPVLVWTLWWAGLIVAVALLGNAFCFVCPWDAVANLVSRLSFWKKRDSLSMSLPVPKILTTIYPAILLFVLLTWLELGFGITKNGRQTAYLGVMMVAAAVVFALLFDKKVFCRSLCLVGRVSGMYAQFAPLEIRVRDERACLTCETRDCVAGNEVGYACPTGLELPEVTANTYCTLCTECFTTCPRNAPSVFLRPFGSDLGRSKVARLDEAWLALILLALTGFHGLSMTSVWQDFTPGSSDLVGLLENGLGLSKIAAFSVGMVAIIAVPILIYAVLIYLAAVLSKAEKHGISYRRLFVAQAYSVLPVALFYHLAHNAAHLLHEGSEIIPALSDPLGRGANYFGTAAWVPGPLASMETTWLLQVGLILIGHIFGVVVSHRISRRLFEDEAAARRSLYPVLVMMVLLSICGLWLMGLDMNMRVGRM